MKSTTATNTNTTTSPYNTQAAKRLERAHSQLAGFATLAQVCRSLSEIHYTYDGKHTPGLTERVTEIQTQFSEALTAAFPTPEALDELSDAAHAAIGSAVRVASPPAATVTPTPDEPYRMHTPPANWRSDPSMLTWKDIASMETADREDALRAKGFRDSGAHDSVAAIQSINTWVSHVLNANPARLADVLMWTRLAFVFEMERQEEAMAKQQAADALAPKAKAKKKAK